MKLPLESLLEQPPDEDDDEYDEDAFSPPNSLPKEDLKLDEDPMTHNLFTHTLLCSAEL